MSTTEHDLVGGRPRRRRDLRADHAANGDAGSDAAESDDSGVETDATSEGEALAAIDGENGADLQTERDTAELVDPGVVVVPYSVGDATAELMLRDSASASDASADGERGEFDDGEHRGVIDLSEFSPPHGVAVAGPPLSADEFVESEEPEDSEDIVALFERFGLSEPAVDAVVDDVAGDANVADGGEHELPDDAGSAHVAADDASADAAVAGHFADADDGERALTNGAGDNGAGDNGGLVPDELHVDGRELDETMPLAAVDARRVDEGRPSDDLDPLEALRRSNIDGPTVRLHPQDDPSVQRRPTRRPVDYNPAPNPIPTPVPRLLGRKPRVRKVTRVVRHVDPWSVFKVAFIAHLVLYVILLTAGVLLWNVAEATGTIDNVERFLESFGWSSFEFRGEEIYRQAWIGGLFAVVGLTGLAVLVATLFNLITDLVGGVRFTVLEEEVVERRTSSMRRFVLRRSEPPVPAKVQTSAGLAHREALVDDAAAVTQAEGSEVDRSGGAGVNGADSR